MAKEEEHGRVSVNEVIANFAGTMRIQNLSDVKEDMVRWCYEAERAISSSDTYIDRECELTIKNHRAELPKNFFRLVGMKQGDKHIGVTSRAFAQFHKSSDHLAERGNSTETDVIGYHEGQYNFPSSTLKYGFAIRNNYLEFSSIESGQIGISYKALPIGDDGYPLIKEGHQEAVEAYLRWMYMIPDWLDGKIDTGRYNTLERRWKELCSRERGNDNLPNEIEMHKLADIWNSAYKLPHKNFF